MNILILGALPRTPKEVSFYSSVVDTCNKYTATTSSPIDTVKFSGSDQERYKRAFKLVNEADIIIGELSYPSTGQGMELREAINQNKEIYVFARKESKASGLIKGCPEIKVVYYQEINDFNAQLDLLLKESKCTK